ncbi:PIN domain-containing protein [Pseudomonas koreensis]|uniref:PIN-like domain-containing protein n=1 Tax=Pseudomonas koreensis TaxID=198620 RepID=UPI003017E657
MKDVFSSHFADDAERRVKLWKNCFFVFDTNVLTSVYKRSDDARDALYKVIESLGDRLWIPYQVIYELLDNRASIAHAQAGLYTAAVASLTSVIDNFDSATKHPFLPEALHKEFVEVSNRVIVELETKRDFHESRLTVDDVKTSLSQMLMGKVGSRYSEDQLKAIVKEGEVRYANRIPPGFEDIGKHKGSTVFSDVCKRYGDLIIWKQVIERAKTVKKPVILVTGEQKEDWWARQGGKTIGPLPRLIEEFSDETGEDFFLYSHHQFLDLANTYLEQTTSPEVIDEVREAALDDAAEWKVTFDNSLNHAWPHAVSEDFDEINTDSAHNDPLSGDVALAFAQLLATQRAYKNVIANRAPSDPREVRRRKREAERLAAEIYEEQKRSLASQVGKKDVGGNKV